MISHHRVQLVTIVDIYISWELFQDLEMYVLIQQCMFISAQVAGIMAALDDTFCSLR